MLVETKQSLFKILICDDDPADRKLVRTYLQQTTGREFVLLEAGRTDEIQSALDKGRIDLVLMDNQMPGKSGMEWLAEIAGSSGGSGRLPAKEQLVHRKAGKDH
jgi:CheY-like chemotaxis protein